jgi:hypothetical protein
MRSTDFDAQIEKHRLAREASPGYLHPVSSVMVNWRTIGYGSRIQYRLSPDDDLEGGFFVGLQEKDGKVNFIWGQMVYVDDEEEDGGQPIYKSIPMKVDETGELSFYGGFDAWLPRNRTKARTNWAAVSPGTPVFFRYSGNVEYEEGVWEGLTQSYASNGEILYSIGYGHVGSTQTGSTGLTTTTNGEVHIDPRYVRLFGQ